MVEMVNNPRIMYKFGQTEADDILERFTPEYAKKYNFDPTKVLLCEDFVLTPIWSTYVTREQANEAESSFKEKYPKNVLTYKKYNGITECRYFTYDQSVAIVENLSATFPYQEKQPEMIKIYWLMAKRKETEPA